MKLYVIEPEVAGEMGENTVFDNYEEVVVNGGTPVISHLHYVFMGWLGDDILETTPCFLVSERLKNAIVESDLKGYEFQNVEISVGEDFEEMYPDIILPCFYRLIPLGNVCVQDEKCSNPDGMDFCITEKSYLVLSEKAMNVVKDFQIENAEVTEICVE